MKKIILIVAIVLLLVLLIGGGIAYYYFNQEYGLSESQPISHTSFAGENTKFRIALNTEGLAQRLNRLLPADLEIPAPLPWEREELLEKVLPREITVLVTPIPQDGQVTLEFFANEKRGGPFLAELGNQEAVLNQVPGVQWRADGLRLEERGVLRADGQIPLSKSGNQWINKRFLPAKDLTALTLSGEHQLEFVLDNRHGEALLLAASIMESNGQSWDRFVQEPMATIALETCTNIQDCRFMADWESMDRIVIKIMLRASQDAGEQLVTAMELMLLPKLKEALQKEYGIYFAGEMVWIEDEGKVVGDFTLNGIEAVLHRYLSTGKFKK